MNSRKVKIFLAYHKSAPIYKSELFQPIKVGGGNLEGCISDNSGDNISSLNPYYCELTGQYWVLKNYLNNCQEEYVGFAHYRRLPDLINVSDEDEPSIFGMNYSESIKLFSDLNNSDIYEYCKKYDVIIPCSCYMYSNTVNPMLKSNEQHYNVYEHFRVEHKNNLPDVLKEVIDNNYPLYSDALTKCYLSEKSHFYNIYVMKRDLMGQYLNFVFDVLEKTGNKIGGWEQEEYKRMAGFVSEVLVNIWLCGNNLTVGYTPVYMIDFEAEYIEKANSFHEKGMIFEEINELRKLLDVTNDKFTVCCAILEANLKSGNISECEKYAELTKSYAENGEDFYNLACVLSKHLPEKSDIIESYFIKSTELCPAEKLYALSFLNYAEKCHNPDMVKRAWDLLSVHELTEEEEVKRAHFIKIYNMINI